MEDALVDFCIGRFNRMSAERAPFENDWMDIRDLVRPVSVGYSKLTQSYYSLRTEFMYDGTAPDSLEELAATLHSYVTNPTERWFELQLEDDYDLAQDPEAKLWLEACADRIYSYYQREDSMLNQSLHEIYLDLGSFGTAIMNQEWSTKNDGLLFSAKPLGDCYIAENSEGIVDTLFRKVCWSGRQIEQEFGYLPPLLQKEADANQDRNFEVLHCVYPRTDRHSDNPLQSSKKFASVWITISTKERLKVSGYDEFPYHTPRWTKLTGEMYGRGPCKKCLPDIKMLNAMEKTLLKAGQKAVDPPVVFDNEGFMLPIRTSPGAIIYKEAGTEPPLPLKFEGNLPWGLEQAEGKRRFIAKCFYGDWFKMGKENVEMTAFEVQDRREEMLRKVAPMLGRLASELQGPTIKRSYQLLLERNRLPPAPGTLSGKTLKVGYLSQASRAQIGTKAINLSRFVQDLTPLAQLFPGIMDVIDTDKFAEIFATARGVPRTALRSAKDLAAIREDRAKQQQMQQMASVAEPASKAMKNIADANSKGGGIEDMMSQ